MLTNASRGSRKQRSSRGGVLLTGGAHNFAAMTKAADTRNLLSISLLLVFPPLITGVSPQGENIVGRETLGFCRQAKRMSGRTN
jgi:hypothetical protein